MIVNFLRVLGVIALSLYFFVSANAYIFAVTLIKNQLEVSVCPCVYFSSLCVFSALHVITINNQLAQSTETLKL